MKLLFVLPVLALALPCLSQASDVTGLEPGPIIVEEATVQASRPVRKVLDPKTAWQVFDAELSCPAGQLQYPKALDPESPRGQVLVELENVFDGMAQLQHLQSLSGVAHYSAATQAKRSEVEQRIQLAKKRVEELARQAQLPARKSLETIHQYRQRLFTGGQLRKGADYVASCKQYSLK